MTSISATHKKRGRPATGKNPQVNVRMDPALKAALDVYASSMPDAPARSEIVRRIIQERLVELGYLDSSEK